MSKLSPLTFLWIPLLAYLIFHPHTSWAQNNLTPNEIVQKVDAIRNPELDYTTTAKVTSFKPDGTVRTAMYEVLVKGRDNSITKTLQPEIERGRSLLMRGANFWAFFPEVEKPIRITLQQKLIGDVANGDIARTNFSADYNASFVRDETLEDKEYYVLKLLAKNDHTTYGKVVLWVEHDTFRPFKAEFYAISGHFLKSCSYENYQMLAGELRPSRLVLKDAIRLGQYSTIEYNEMNIEEIPQKYFTKEYLKKLVN